MNTKTDLAGRLRASVTANDGRPTYPGGDAFIRNLIIEAAEALSTSSDARVGVKVKALGWGLVHGGIREHAVTIVGAYEIGTTSDGSSRKPYWRDADHVRRYVASVDEAKAAAQSDYTARILSALAPASSGEREELARCPECGSTRPTLYLSLPHGGICTDAFHGNPLRATASPEKDEPVAEPFAWHCVGRGEGWAEDKIVRSQEDAEFYTRPPWTVTPLYRAPPSLADAVAALQAEIDWHEAEDKALSKQPPGGDRQWRRLQHQEQAENLRAALAKIEGGRS